MTDHTAFWRSPSRGFPGFPAAIRQITGDCTHPPVTSNYPLLTDASDVTLGENDQLLRNRKGTGGTTTLALRYFGRRCAGEW